MRRVGVHEFERGEQDVWECVHCGMKAVTGHFDGVETLPCTYARDNELAETDGE